MTGKQAIKSYERLKRALENVEEALVSEQHRNRSKRGGDFEFDPSWNLSDDVQNAIEDCEQNIADIEQRMERDRQTRKEVRR